MINRPRRRSGALLTTFAGLMLLAWLGMVFVARALAGDEKTAGFAAFVGFLVICFSTVVYVLFMMAVDSDKA
ncbi:MAG TPA: hypothetical protein VFS62_13365 [Chloroflexota bacterium]|jgi:hypothetical protein|nr:hypothetical protein [Chloroflexota bacterium]